jgi:hypothetical protein
VVWLLPDALVAQLREEAARERRSVSRQVEVLLVQALAADSERIKAAA